MKLTNFLSYASILAYSFCYTNPILSQAMCTEGQTKGCLPEPKDTVIDDGGQKFSNTMVWILSTIVIVVTMWALIASGRALMRKEYQDSAVNLLAAFIVGGSGAIILAIYG